MKDFLMECETVARMVCQKEKIEAALKVGKMDILSVGGMVFDLAVLMVEMMDD